MGVPVITAGNDVIVGFDRPRLEQIAARYSQSTHAEPARPKLGLAVRPAPAGGAEVGAVRPGSPAEQAGFQAGDIVETIGGQRVRDAADVEKVISTARPGERLDAVVWRGGQSLHLSIGL